MARILLISYYYPPMNNGGVQRPAKLVKYLRRLGHTVSVVTHGYLSQPLVVADGVYRIDVSRWSLRNIWLMPWRVFRVWTDQHGWWKRPFDVWSYLFRRVATRIMTESSPDVIIATYPSAAVLEIALELHKKYSTPFIADLRDGILFEPTNPAISSGALAPYYMDLERRTADAASAIVTVSDPITEYYASKYPRTRSQTITNAFDPDDFVDVKPATLTSTQKHVVFTGRLTLSDATCNPQPFFSALEELSSSGVLNEDSFQLHMIGEFSVSEQVMMAPLVARNVIRLYPAMPREQAMSYQLRADALLLLTSTSRRGVVTGKIFEYLWTKRPILGLTAGTAAAEIITQTQSGLVIDPLDTREVSRAIRQILAGTFHSQPALATRIERYSWQSCALLYSDQIRRVASSPR